MNAAIKEILTAEIARVLKEWGDTKENIVAMRPTADDYQDAAKAALKRLLKRPAGK